MAGPFFPFGRGMFALNRPKASFFSSLSLFLLIWKKIYFFFLFRSSRWNARKSLQPGAIDRDRCDFSLAVAWWSLHNSLSYEYNIDKGRFSWRPCIKRLVGAGQGRRRRREGPALILDRPVLHIHCLYAHISLFYLPFVFRQHDPDNILTLYQSVAHMMHSFPGQSHSWSFVTAFISRGGKGAHLLYIIHRIGMFSFACDWILATFPFLLGQLGDR